MGLIQELIVSFLKSEELEIVLSEKFNLERIVENECYKALKIIKEIIGNEDWRTQNALQG